MNGTVDPLSFDHKPNNDDERKRITAAGGWVEFNRVNGTLDSIESQTRLVFFSSIGNLALSRALGDFIFKRNTDKRAEEQVVTGRLENLSNVINLVSSVPFQLRRM